MVGDGRDEDPAEPRSTTLREFYQSIQDQLVLLIERSLDLDRKDLAGLLDDILLRQRFWEDDIRLGDGALSNLEANDALASSIIRRYLDEIRHLLYEISRDFSVPFTYVSLFPLGCVAAQCEGYLSMLCLSSSNFSPTNCDQ